MTLHESSETRCRVCHNNRFILSIRVMSQVTNREWDVAPDTLQPCPQCSRHINFDEFKEMMGRVPILDN